ncbi:MAG: DUF2066 domain-containing protein [Pseudomonadota bacterium]
MRYVLATFGALVVLGSAPLLAQDDLYVGQGALDPTSNDTNAAMIQALDEVLVRLTGQVEGQVRQQLGLGVGGARQLVQSQQRVRVELVDENGESTEVLRLQVQFVPSAIDRRLADAGVPRWGQERPSLLLWIAVADQDGARLSTDPLLDSMVFEQGRRLGLDVLRPLGDLIDLSEVDVIDVRGGFLDAAEPSLARYQASVPVMLDLRQESDERWTARWSWRLEGRDQSASLSADGQAPLIEQGMELVMANLAQRYAVRPDQLGIRRQSLVVSPIVDEVQYAEVLAHLEGLSMVESVHVTGARGDSVDFDLVLNSAGLLDALGLGGLLLLDSTATDGRLRLTFAQ